jgi:hypothetical protein
VPWSALDESPEKFLDPCFLPADVQLKEISKMRAATLNACVSHWAKRVENGKIAFRFKAVEDSHRREEQSRKKRPQPVSDDEQEDEAISTGGKNHQGSVEGKNETDGEDDDPVEEKAGKGKAKALGRMWYDCISAGSSRDTAYCNSQPIRCA